MNDGRCEDCGGTSPIAWYVDSDRWNHVTANMPKGRASVLCTTCYGTRWETVTGLTAVWHLVPENIRTNKPPETAATCSSSPLDNEQQPVVFFRGRIRDAGGGEVTILLDRETERYPRIGAHVVVDELTT